MLKSLSIRNVVLIEQLDISFAQGFHALTGETGAGKSILLDALGLALGNRSSQSYIRQGALEAVVSAEFFIPSDSPIERCLQDHGLSAENGTVILRRIVQQDGRTRAFINDQPVSVKLLQEVGGHLMEVHGQFDQLLDANSHRSFLDAYAQLEGAKLELKESYEAWRAVDERLQDLENSTHLSMENIEFLKQSLRELDDLDIQDQEEETLIQERQRLSQQAKYQKSLDAALHSLKGEGAAYSCLYEAMRSIERVKSAENDSLNAVLQGLERAYHELTEATHLLESHITSDQGSYASLEQVEDRLFTLRAAARRHNCLIAQLPEKREKIRDDLTRIENREALVHTLNEEAIKLRHTYLQQAQLISGQRLKAAEALDSEVMKELPPLKLDRASFKTEVLSLPEDQWSEHGIDKVQFTISTNPGSSFGALSHIASGGERARFMLALKVVLAQNSMVPVLVFDEVDQGVGGAVAHAIGERLARLSERMQVLAITHAPQIAALAHYHLRVEKHQSDMQTITRVVILDTRQRLDEIARMLAGEHITPQALAAAETLLQQKQA